MLRIERKYFWYSVLIGMVCFPLAYWLMIYTNPDIGSSPVLLLWLLAISFFSGKGARFLFSKASKAHDRIEVIQFKFLRQGLRLAKDVDGNLIVAREWQPTYKSPFRPH